MLLKARDVEITNDAYLSIPSRGWLLVPPKLFGDFMCSNFAILDFIMAFSLPVKTSATYVLSCYGPKSDFTHVKHLYWGFNFTNKIIVNIFFNNKQRMSRDIIR